MRLPLRSHARLRVFARAATIVAALGLLVWSVRMVSWAGLLATLLGIGPAVGLVLVPGLAATLAQTAGWRALLRPMGQLVAWGALVRVRLSSEALYLSAPGGGAAADAVSVLLLGRLSGLAPAAALVAVAGRKLLIVLANGAAAALVLALGLEAVLRISHGLGAGSALGWLVGVAMVVLLSAALGGRAAAAALAPAAAVGRQLERLPLRALRRWIRTRTGAFAAVDARLAELGRVPAGPIALGTGAYLLAWLAEVSETWLLLRLLGVPLGVVDVVALELLVSLVRSVAFVAPGGIGVQDAAYVSLLEAMGACSPTTGFALVLLKRGRDVVWTTVGLTVLATSRSRRPSAARGRGSTSVNQPALPLPAPEAWPGQRENSCRRP